MSTNNTPLTIALVGAPNSGKTAFFNALTNSHYKSTNFPGVTIELHHQQIEINSRSLNIIDLPGIYSLNTQSFDEGITRDYLLQKNNSFLNQQANKISLNYDLLILIADATNLDKSLYLAKELQFLQIPFFVVLTHEDISIKEGQQLDLKLWQQGWNLPLYTINNFDPKSFEKVKNFLGSLDLNTFSKVPKFLKHQELLADIANPTFVANAFKSLDLDLARFQLTKISPLTLTKRIDKYLLHSIAGPIIMIFILLLLFQILFTVAAPLQELIEVSLAMLHQLIEASLAPSLLRNLLTEGVLSGVGSVIVFLPQIALLSLLITILEDCGYLSRLAFLLDSFMKRFGLPGKAIVPLLTSHACAIPGIMATRNLEQEDDRLTTMMVAPLTTCSARLPVYALLISAFIPTVFWGPISLQALTLLALYLIGISASFIVAWILKKKVFKTTPIPLLLQLPRYKVPQLKNLWLNVKMQSLAFITKAGGVILVLSLLIWGLATFPQSEHKNMPSYAEQIGKSIQPVLAPLGFDWKLSAALIPSFAAREVMVSALATVYSVEIDDPENQEQTSSLKELLAENYDLGTMMALLMWFAFAPQCISTFAIIKKESHGYKWPLVTFAYALILAYLFAWIAKLLF